MRLWIAMFVALLSHSSPAANANGAAKSHGYAPVNGLKMYYEIDGTGEPLVYIHPALGHAGMKSFPGLTRHHRVISIDLQGHGRTADIPERPLTLEQHCEDVVGLLKYLGIARADFFGESYGGAIATMIAIRHPEMAGRVATYGATFGPPLLAIRPEVANAKSAPTANDRAFAFQRESYRKVAPHPEDWPQLWSKVVSMKWEGFDDESLASIRSPLLIALGDHDFVRLEHAVDTLKRIPTAELAVVPDASHFVLFAEPDKVMPTIQRFLDAPEKKLPLASSATGYHPGETR